VAAEIKDTLGVDVELIAGSGGVFIVRGGEKIVYNKQDSGVFPVEGTIIDLLKR
jgi:predicted Rdx family selenoprotein